MILFIGNTQVPWCTEVHLGRSLQALGFEVEHLQENTIAGADGIRRLKRKVGAYQAIFYMRTWGVHGLDRVWKEARKLGIPTVTISLDIYWGVHRQRMLRDDPMFRTDHVFTADGNGHPWADHRINHHWLPAGVVRDECADVMPGKLVKQWARYRVAFVGTRGADYHREWPFRGELIDALRKRFGDRFVQAPHDLWGMGRLERNVALRGQALNDFYATVPVIVGDSLGASRDTFYWSDRFYETWGRGGYLLHPEIDGLYAEVGQHPAYEAGSVDSAVAQAEWALDHPGYREEAQRFVSERVRERSNYILRMAQVCKTVGLVP